MQDLRFVYFTNEKTFPLAEITSLFFIKHANTENLKLTIVSNKIPEETTKNKKIEYFDANVQFVSDGKHFGDCLLKFLKTIDEEYIFLMCDDYIFFRDIKWNQMNSLMKMIRSENVDYFGFDDINPEYVKNFTLIDKKYDGLEDGVFFKRWHDYQYLYSVQPTIWKTSKLLEILEAHLPMGPHCLDLTRDDIREYTRGNTTALYSKLKSCFTYENTITDDYFCISYIEIVRHGRFMLPENGYGHAHDFGTILVEKIIKDFNLLTDDRFKKLLYNKKP